MLKVLIIKQALKRTRMREREKEKKRIQQIKEIFEQ